MLNIRYLFFYGPIIEQSVGGESDTCFQRAHKVPENFKQ